MAFRIHRLKPSFPILVVDGLLQTNLAEHAAIEHFTIQYPEGCFVVFEVERLGDMWVAVRNVAGIVNGQVVPISDAFSAVLGSN